MVNYLIHMRFDYNDAQTKQKSFVYATDEKNWQI